MAGTPAGYRALPAIALLKEWRRERRGRAVNTATRFGAVPLSAARPLGSRRPRLRASACCAPVNFGFRPMRCPRFCDAAAAFGGAGADKIALHVTPSRRERQSSGARCWCRCRPTVGQGSELRLGVHDLLDDREQVKGAAREAVNPRHRHHVTGGEGLQHFEKLAPVVVRARRSPSRGKSWRCIRRPVAAPAGCRGSGPRC